MFPEESTATSVTSVKVGPDGIFEINSSAFAELMFETNKDSTITIKGIMNKARMTFWEDNAEVLLLPLAFKIINKKRCQNLGNRLYHSIAQFLNALVLLNFDRK